MVKGCEIMNLGEKIKYYREVQKMGQENLAALSHISVSAIRKYESGERIPKDSQIEKIAIALHISPIALRDIHFENFTELLPYLYEISKWGGISFDGPKDDNGKYIEDSLNLRFGQQEIRHFFKEWADKKEECSQILEAASSITDSTTKELMLQRVKEIENEIESSLVSDKITNNIYREFDIPTNYASKRIKENTQPLKTYADYLNILNTLARTGIKWECCGIFERIWDAKAIFTFEADSLDKDKMSGYSEDAYAKFLFYFGEIKKFKIKTNAFAYQQGSITYYRYVIEDRVLATSLSIIQEIIDTKSENLDDDERSIFEDTIIDRIKMFNIPIEMGK